jgi:hypothetical protein
MPGDFALSPETFGFIELQLIVCWEEDRVFLNIHIQTKRITSQIHWDMVIDTRN